MELHYPEQASLKALSLGVPKAKRGYKRGYKFTFDFAKPNAYAGLKASLKRLYSTKKLKKAHFLWAFFRWYGAWLS
jgi:hypothetical protein